MLPIKQGIFKLKTALCQAGIFEISGAYSGKPIPPYNNFYEILFQFRDYVIIINSHERKTHPCLQKILYR